MGSRYGYELGKLDGLSLYSLQNSVGVTYTCRPCISKSLALFKLLLLLMFILFLREREREQAGEGQREGDTGSKAGSRLRAVSTEPDTGLELTNQEIVT